jgi:hypothetical protein
MNEAMFDALTRRSAPRRASLLALGAAGLAAIDSPFSAAAKSNKNKKKNKSDRKSKQAEEECQQQLTQCTAQATMCADQPEQCTALFTSICAGNPACLDQTACCASLANCDVNAFFTCLVTS